MLNTQLLNETGRKHARRERPPENRAELLVQATYAHILKLEIRRQDGIWGRLFRTRLDLDLREGILQKRHLRLFHRDAGVGPARETSAASATASLFRGEFEDAHALDDALEILAVVFEHEDLPDGKDDVTEPTDESRCHVVYGELFCNLEVSL
jgi:hypothetical protein